MPKPCPKKKRVRKWKPPQPDPRPAARILDEDVLLTKAMLAKVLGYKSVRSVDNIVREDCARGEPCLRPIYVRVPQRNGRTEVFFPEDFPALQSLRFRVEDVKLYLAKRQRDFPEDWEWRVGATPGAPRKTGS